MTEFLELIKNLEDPMPEGPEVLHVARTHVQPVIGRTVKRVSIKSGRYMRAPIPEISNIEGAFLERIKVKGKLIVLYFMKGNERFAVLSTLGMTGWWYLEHTNSLQHLRIELELEGSPQFLCFCDPRNFGTFKVVSLAEAKRKLNELGPDIMTPAEQLQLCIPQFEERLNRFGKNVTIAEALLDQRIAAGCGNYLRADGLYMAQIDPRRAATSITGTERVKIWCALYDLSHSALEDRHPLINGASYRNVCYGQQRGHYGEPVESYSDRHGRTVWWAPSRVKDLVTSS
jgi:formamidopyrimidine-DNA glycosylase